MGKPKNQFKRPSIDLGGPVRVWRDVPAHTLTAGDIVVDHGRLEGFVTDEESGTVKAFFLSGKTVLFRREETVRAFVQS